MALRTGGSVRDGQLFLAGLAAGPAGLPRFLGAETETASATTGTLGGNARLKLDHVCVLLLFCTRKHSYLRRGRVVELLNRIEGHALSFWSIYTLLFYQQQLRGSACKNMSRILPGLVRVVRLNRIFG